MLIQHRAPPSHHGGFARSPGESRNPGLWQGLIGAWLPSIQPGGKNLRDYSGNTAHATGNSANFDTYWTRYRGVQVIDGSQSGGYAEVLDGGLKPTEHCTFLSRFRFTTASGSVGICKREPSGGGIIFQLFRHSSNVIRARVDTAGGFETTDSVTTTTDTDKFYVIGMSYDGVTTRIWIDGALDNSEVVAFPGPMVNADSQHFDLIRQGTTAGPIYFAEALLYDRAIPHRQIALLSNDMLAPFQLGSTFVKEAPPLPGPTYLHRSFGASTYGTGRR